MFAAGGDGGDYVVVVARKDYADGNLAVVGAVAGVKSAAAVVEADFAVDVLAQGCVKCG